MLNFKIGQVVRTTQHVTDVDSNGRSYIHALKGGHGIVIAIVYEAPYGYSEEEIDGGVPNGYTVAWEPEGHGVMDVSPHSLEEA